MRRETQFYTSENDPPRDRRTWRDRHYHKMATSGSDERRGIPTKKEKKRKKRPPIGDAGHQAKRDNSHNRSINIKKNRGSGWNGTDALTVCAVSAVCARVCPSEARGCLQVRYTACRRFALSPFSITDDRSKQDLRYTQKPMYFPIFSNIYLALLTMGPHNRETGPTRRDQKIRPIQHKAAT